MGIFDTMVWNAMNDDVLHFSGNGKYGTLLKGLNISSGSGRGVYSQTALPSDDEAWQWLVKNFGTSAPAPTLPSGLQIHIPVDRAFDTQWNPPGVPTLSASNLQSPDKWMF